MKITKIVSIPDQEVEIEVSAEDIALAIGEDVEQERTCTYGITNAWRFFKAIPESVISGMHEAKRETIYRAFLEQAQRYAPKVTNEAIRTGQGIPREVVAKLLDAIAHPFQDSCSGFRLGCQCRICEASRAVEKAYEESI